MQWFQIIMALLPVVKEAVDTVAKATGKSPDAALGDVIAHLTPGQPNAPALDFKAPK